MKREFGKKLIEEFFAHKVELTRVVDTSGAYIPNHGTPTVILFGRRRLARFDSTIRAVLGVQGEPGQPEDPAKGLVWQAISRQIEHPGSESAFVSVVDVDRDYLAKYPWSLSGGGAGDVRELIDKAPNRLSKFAASIGFMAVTREDEASVLAEGRHGGWD